MKQQFIILWRALPIITSDLRSQAEAITEGYNGLHYENGNITDLKQNQNSQQKKITKKE